MSTVWKQAEDLPLAAELAAVYARMAGLLLSEESMTTALGMVTSLAAETIPGSAGAGVTLTDRDGRRGPPGAPTRWSSARMRSSTSWTRGRA